jgi:hypothetical protein
MLRLLALVQEKRVGSRYSKMAVPYFGQTTPIALDDIPNKYMKVENPARANIIHDEAALLGQVFKNKNF